MESTYPHKALQQGDMLNWYRIEHTLGRGGFGVIYLATDTNLDHKVAIKEYLPGDVATRTGDSQVSPLTDELEETYRWGMDRFIAEARNLVQFNHPNIVRVMSVFQANNTAYMVMEFEEGVDLRTFLKQPGNVNEATLKKLIQPISEGLADVHQQGFIHRDIKPTNILVRSKSATPVLLDFGSARNASRFTQNLTALVSVGYAPLEQYSSESDEQQGPWTDIYALGGTLYYAIAGTDPVESTRRATALFNSAKDPLIPALFLGEGKFSPEFLRAIDWAMQFRIADRPQNLTDWMAALLGNASVPTAAIAAPSGLSIPVSLESDVQLDASADNNADVSTDVHKLHSQQDPVRHTDATVLSHKTTGESGAVDLHKLHRRESSKHVVGESANSHDRNSKRPGTFTADGRKNNASLRGSKALTFSALVLGAVAVGIWIIALQDNDDTLSVAGSSTDNVVASEPVQESTQTPNAESLDTTAAAASTEVITTVAADNTASISTDASLVTEQGRPEPADASRRNEPAAIQEANASTDQLIDNAETDNVARAPNPDATVSQRDRNLASEPAQDEQGISDQATQSVSDKAEPAVEHSDELSLEKKAQALADIRARELAEQEAQKRLAAAQRKSREAAIQLARERIERRLKQAISSAQNSLSVGDLDAAQQQLNIAESIDDRDARVQTLGFAVEAAKKEYDKPVSDADFDTVTRMFDGLRRAIEAKDAISMDRLAGNSEQSALFKALMKRFERFDIEISAIRVRNARKAITGTLRINAMIRSNGDRATPSPAYRSREIKSVRVNGGWSKIQW